jgi:hypothetical protein
MINKFVHFFISSHILSRKVKTKDKRQKERNGNSRYQSKSLFRAAG